MHPFRVPHIPGWHKKTVWGQLFSGWVMGLSPSLPLRNTSVTVSLCSNTSSPPSSYTQFTYKPTVSPQEVGQNLSSTPHHFLLMAWSWQQPLKLTSLVSPLWLSPSSSESTLTRDPPTILCGSRSSLDTSEYHGGFNHDPPASGLFNHGSTETLLNSKTLRLPKRRGEKFPDCSPDLIPLHMECVLVWLNFMRWLSYTNKNMGNCSANLDRYLGPCTG